jgi:transcriptional regulator with GAF, ATPase, and Fis domain
LLHSFLTSLPGSQSRNQVKWIFGGAVAAAFPITYTLFLAAVRPDQFGFGGATWPMFFASLCITLGYGISISRYGLMSVSEVLNLQILSIGVSVGAGIVFSILVFVGMVAIDQAMGSPSPFWHAAWVTAVAWAMLAVTHLARDRLRQILHRRLHKTKFALDETMRRMTLAVEQRIDPVQLGRRYLLGLSELIGFEQGAIYLRTGTPPVYRLAAHLGTEPPAAELAAGCPLIDALEKAPFIRLRPGQPGYREPAQRQLNQLLGVMALPLRHEGTLLAVLLVGAADAAMSEIEALHLLTTFSQMAGIALHSVQSHETLEGLHRELQAKVEKIAEMQKRIVALQSQLSRQNLAALSDGLESSRPQAVDATASVEGIVAASDSMRHLLATVRKVAASPSAALIRGESGTGKEVVARALHEWSPRSKGPFVKVHCAALSPGLLESELFGHVKGAFTGAHRDKVGRFELADKGTLFLDEIGDISLDVQTKLLRVLQEMTFERVGSSEPISVDVRVVAATNQDLEKLMREGRFREDLFFRLNVITIRTPPLRERREDILELALHFLRLYTQRSGRSSLLHFDDDAIALLKGYSWPGNVRELENVVERAVVLAESDVITPAELPEELRQSARVVVPVSTPSYQLRSTPLLEPQHTWTAQQEAAERQRLVQALSAAGGNKAQAARALGMPRSTFLSKLEKHGLVPRRT